MNRILSNVATPQFQSFNLSQTLIQQELNGIFGSEMLTNLKHILDMYKVYEQGAEFSPEGGNNGDYIPAQHRYKIIKGLIDKEARFLFSVPPTITLEALGEEKNENVLSNNQALVNEVLKRNHFNSKLVRAAKDCLIGGRIAIVANFNSSGIDINFIPSLEFVYETDPADVELMTKFIQFYSVVVNEEKSQQRIYKKKWELKNGYVYVTEELYDGNARLVETLISETKTKFEYIPAWVVINEGLTGDAFGVSDVEAIEEDEAWFSKLGSKDIDSIRKGTDQIVYTMDVNPKATSGLSRAAGSFWDLNTDPAATEGKTGQVGTLDNSMAYSPALDTTLKRIRANMYSQLDVPDTTSEALQGIVTSGKTMEAIYWGLMVRCGEKMLDWIPAIEGMVEAIIHGSILYPESKKIYIDANISEEGYKIKVENSYPILRDESEEKTTDVMEINAKVMSRKSYLKKWRGLTDEEATKELEQIQLEQNMFEDSNYFLGSGEEE